MFYSLASFIAFSLISLSMVTFSGSLVLAGEVMRINAHKCVFNTFCHNHVKTQEKSYGSRKQA